jgi:hypothetical protein
LLWEAHSVSDLTADHLLTIGAIVGAIAAGHFFWHMLRSCKFGAALGLGIAFAAATTYCLIGSAGRGDEAAFEKNAAARQINEDRERFQRDRTEAKQRWDAAVTAETQECSGGQGSKCLAKREITKQRRSDYEVADLLVRQSKAEARENGKLKRAAELISFFGRVEQATAEKGLALVWPFIPPLVCELLTIVFLHLAFAVPAPRRGAAASISGAARPETVTSKFSGKDFHAASVAGNARQPASDDLEAVLSALRAQGRSATNAELAVLMRVSEGEASKRAKACGGAIVKEREGRTVRLSLPQRLH